MNYKSCSIATAADSRKAGDQVGRSDDWVDEEVLRCEGYVKRRHVGR